MCCTIDYPQQSFVFTHLVAVLRARLDGMYKSNFLRVYPNGATDKAWLKSRNLLSFICASREPLPFPLVAHLLEWDNEQGLDFIKQTSISLLFPIKDGCFHVYHKTVVDWLRDKDRKARGEVFVITDEQVQAAHVALGSAALKLKLKTLSSGALPWGGVHSLLLYYDSTKTLGPELLYLIQHGARHFVEASSMATAELRERAREQALDLLSDFVIAETRIHLGQFTDILLDLGDLGGKDPRAVALQNFFQNNRSLLISHPHATLQQVRALACG